LVVELHQLAAAVYLAAGLGAFLGLALPASRLGRAASWMLGLGALFQAAAFARLHTLSPPPSLTDLPAAVSFMSWVAVLFCLLLQRRGRLEGLTGLVALLAFAGAFYAGLALRGAPGSGPPAGGSWPHLHVILASAGLALLGVAGLAGVLFLAEDRSLKAKRPVVWGARLPSLEALDRVNLISLALGFPLLTFGVIAGMLWTQGMTGRLWPGDAHAVWSGIGWAIYLALAIARFGVGWRGREAAACAAAGFAFLLFAVIGVGAVA
jgi:ABC-type uncharacterized transport system permease subunit